MNTIKLICLVLLLFFTYNSSFAQLKEKYEYGFGVGVTNYKGDINPTLKLNNARLGINGFFRLNLKRGLSWRGGGSIMFITGNDALADNPLNTRRNIQFTSTILGVESVLEYHFFDLNAKSEYYFSPYVFGGLGLMRYGSKSNSILEQGSKDQSAFSVTLPFGVGIKKLITNELAISVEASTYKTANDLIDFTNDKNNSGFIQRFDTYYYFSFNVSFRILDVVCPKPSINF